MKKQKRLKNKHLTDTEIELFCRGVEEVLTKITDRCSHKGSKETDKRGHKNNKQTDEEELITCSQ